MISRAEAKAIKRRFSYKKWGSWAFYLSLIPIFYYLGFSWAAFGYVLLAMILGTLLNLYCFVATEYKYAKLSKEERDSYEDHLVASYLKDLEKQQKKEGR